MFWIIFKKILHRKLDLLLWMCDPSHNPPKVPVFMQGILEILKERSYKNFIKCIPDILMYLINVADFKKSKEKIKKINLIYDMYKNEKDKIFSSYLPIVNKKLFVMENTSKGKFINLSVAEVSDIIRKWIRYSGKKNSLKNINKFTAGVISNFAYFYTKYYYTFLTAKLGALRKHIYGARSNFTFRNVIVSIEGQHKYNEIYVPWVIGVVLFRPHLINKLINNHNLRYKEASALLYKSVSHKSDLISTLLDELISDSKYELGIPIIIGRNPSLFQGSSQRVFISKFHKNMTINTIDISPLIIKAPNADFDGDEMNALLLIDNKMGDKMATFDPHYSTISLDKPFHVSGNLTFFPPSNTILVEYFKDNDNGENSEKVEYNLFN